ncbi:hypothetical protein [Spirulina subsalsa]|uniref:hypothetical protein n=1 Tax=Spirulina subsalsa TaxID=54311 RepID=UPI0003037C78|nr:hypothetical protein [Spirulina subsalsa]
MSQAYCWELTVGGIGYGEGAEAGLLMATEGEWERIEARLKAMKSEGLWIKQRVTRLLAQRDGKK